MEYLSVKLAQSLRPMDSRCFRYTKLLYFQSSFGHKKAELGKHIIWKFCTKHGSIQSFCKLALLDKISKLLDNREKSRNTKMRQIWVWNKFQMVHHELGTLISIPRNACMIQRRRHNCSPVLYYWVITVIEHARNWNITLRWRHNERDSVSNHQPHHCLLNRSFGRRSK